MGGVGVLTKNRFEERSDPKGFNRDLFGTSTVVVVLAWFPTGAHFFVS